MAEEDMQSGVCSGSWWMRSGTGGGYAGTSASPCSATAAMSEMSSFSWSASDITEMKGRSGDHSVDNHSASLSVGSSMDFQEAQHKADAGGVAIDSSLQLVGFGLSSPAPAPDWSHALIRGAGKREGSLQSMLQDEDLNSPASFRQSIPSGHFQRDWATGKESNINSLKQIHQHNLFGLEQRLNSGECSATGRTVPGNNMENYGYPPPMMQGYVDQESHLLSMPTMNYRLNSQPLFSDEFPQNWSKFPQFLRQTSSSSSSPPEQQITSQLQFANNGPFWNTTITMAAEIRPTLYASSSPSQFLTPTMEEKPSIHSIMTKRSCEETGDASSMELKKSNTTESTFKRPRLDTQSPLPTFKVRKEKLGDRITALQQLVSPFGKTDTASVLHEAIQYIKFLHDQVNALSNPYMKSGVQMQHQHPPNSDKSKDKEGPKQDLRSRGLCLVPISSTFVNNETAADFWTPTFGGHYR